MMMAITASSATRGRCQADRGSSGDTGGPLHRVVVVEHELDPGMLGRAAAIARNDADCRGSTEKELDSVGVRDGVRIARIVAVPGPVEPGPRHVAVDVGNRDDLLL